MNYIIQKYKKSDREDWNNFLPNCKNFHFMFHRDFIEYHSDRFHDFSLIVKDSNNHIIALLPGNIDDETFYSHQGLSFGGYLINNSIKTIELIEIFEETKKFLKENKIKRIIYKCMPIIYHQYPAQEELYILFKNDAQLYRRDISSSIYLDKTYKYSKSRKWGITRANKEGVICVEIKQPSKIWNIIRNVLYERYNTQPVHNEYEIDYLKEKFPNNIKAFAAIKDNNVISAAITFENINVVHTQYLANTDVGKKLYALDMLIDFIIKKSSEYANIFDFGISTENNGHYLNTGLLNQKESFGARAIVHDFYSIELT